MGKAPIKTNMNIYFRARKNPENGSESVYSREQAAAKLHISVSTLSDYENGETKTVPPDKVQAMAELYNKPELRAYYCKHICPLGKDMPLAEKDEGVQGATLNLVRLFDVVSIDDIKRRLMKVAADGTIQDTEKEELKNIISELNNLSYVISAVRIIGEKVLSDNDKYRSY